MKKITQAGAMLWSFLKYQLLSKGLLTLVVFPLASLIRKGLFGLASRTTLSSGDWGNFFLSLPGLGTALLGILILVLLIGVEGNAYILMATSFLEGQFSLSARGLLKASLKACLKFFSLPGILLALFIGLILPIVDSSLSLSSLSFIKVPNFITSVIWSKPAYALPYLGLLTVLTLLVYVHLFTMHYLTLTQSRIGAALTQARSLMFRQWKSLLWALLKWFLWGLGGFVAFLALTGLSSLVTKKVTISEFWAIMGFLLGMEVLFLGLTVWFYQLMFLITRIFLREQGKRDLAHMYPGLGHKPLSGLGAGSLLLILLGLVMTGNILLARFLPQTLAGNPLHLSPKQIIAHRAGGNLAAENSLAGLQAAIATGVDWSEIDVQRSKDGVYVVHHDASLKRLTGNPAKVPDLTWQELQGLQLVDAFQTDRPSQPISRLEDFLDTGKDKIGLMIELKGATADTQMVDQVVAMIQDRGMDKQVVLLSLDYDLINYIEDHYPQMASGYLYYFALGPVADLRADYLIMEEGMATPSQVEDVHSAGKKAIVWTVNTQESLDSFAASQLDGIITDQVLMVQEGLSQGQISFTPTQLLETILP